MAKNYTVRDEEPDDALPDLLPESEWEDASPALSGVVPAALMGLRLDLALPKVFPQFSRNRLQAWLKSGHVMVTGDAAARYEGSTEVFGGEQVMLQPPAAADVAHPPAQKMRLRIVHEDAHVLVINKPAGLIVHPGAGNPDGTLLNGLLAHEPALRKVPRAGIVHRLDKDTSGLMVVAKNVTAQARLAEQLAARTVKRTYLAVVHGTPPPQGLIDAPIGRDPKVRTRMAVVGGGREARTHFKVLKRFDVGLGAAALLECRLDTGRTHQIRVHLQHIKHPLVGDPVYRRGAPQGRPGAPGGWPFPRQALHATALEFDHPKTNKAMLWEAPLPTDMKQLLAKLRRDGLAAP